MPALDALHSAGHAIRAVFTQADRPAGRGLAVQESAVKRRARELGIAVLQPQTFKSPETLAALRGLAVDALVVVAYGLILPAEALAVPRLGAFNIHGSLLPRWRGAAPIQRAILAGDATTGITIMRMDAGLDTGPMLLARAIDILPSDTSASLHDRLAALGGELMCAALEDLSRGTLSERPQPTAGVSYAAKISKGEARIDWRAAAAAIARQVRAFNPWPIAETTYDGAQLRIWEAAPLAVNAEAPGNVLDVTQEGIVVACGSGALRITRLQLAGRKPLPAREFANAHPLAGARFGFP